MTQSRDRHGRLSERIADDLQREILRNGIEPGRRLATELELTERFGVSRTVIREAAKLLVQRGLVTVSPGRGMLVAEFDGAHIADQFSILMLASDGTFEQLLELRLALEVQIATAVARSPSPPTLQRLEDSVQAGERVLVNPGGIDVDAFLDSDMTFHEEMARASGNPFFDLVCRPINSFLRSHYLHQESYPSNPHRTLEEHRQILDSLRRRDTFGARQATEEHLHRLLRKWRAGPQPNRAPSLRRLSTHDTHNTQRVTE